MKAFFLNIISGLKKFFLSRVFKKFISREFLILLLGGAIVGGASLYQEYDRDSIRIYNNTLNFEINKEIDSLNKIIKRDVGDYKNGYAYSIYSYLDKKTSEADKHNDYNRETLAKDGSRTYFVYSWILDPVRSETFVSFSEKIKSKKKTYYRGFGTKEYPLHVYNALSYWDPKFKGKFTYSEFKFYIENTIYSAFDESRELESDLRNKILKLESEILPEKSSALSTYFVEDVTFYLLIILYGLRLFLYIIMSSIRVLRKG